MSTAHWQYTQDFSWEWVECRSSYLWKGVGLTAKQVIAKGFKVRPSSHSDETASFYSLFKIFFHNYNKYKSMKQREVEL